MLYKEKPQIVLIAVSADGEDVTEPRYITGKSVEEVIAVIDAAFPAAEPSTAAPEPKKARKPRRTKEETRGPVMDGDPFSGDKLPEEPAARKPSKPWAD